MTAMTATRVLVCAIALLHVNASAQQKLSRSCPFSEIPAGLQGPFLRLVDLIGDARPGTFDYLIHGSQRLKKIHYIFESLTIDWLEVRYALYAENQVYFLNCPYHYEVASSGCKWRIEYSWKSGDKNHGWTAETMAQEVLNATSVEIFFRNRQFLYSARAGHRDLIQRLPINESDYDLYARPVVVGQHMFANRLGVQQSLGKSSATDCNLQEWGLGTR